MIEKYIKDNKFDRTQLVLDIKNKKIKEKNISSILNELEEFVRRDEIESPYIETKKLDVRKKSEWSKNYLDYLISQVSSAEIFTRESIEYISRVADYVNGAVIRMIKRILAILLGLCVLFLAGYITGRKHGTDSLIGEIDHLQREFAEAGDTNERLYGEIQNLKKENEALLERNSELENGLKNMMQSGSNLLSSKSEKTNTQVEQNINDELSKYIERALKGENVKKEFNAQDEYSSKDVEKRAIEMGLKRNQAQLLIENLANPDKFDINKFLE